MFGKRRSRAPLFCVCFVTTWARAQDSRQFVDLKYEVDATVQGCPNAVEFRAIIAKELGHDPYRKDASLGVGVFIGSTPSGIDGTIAWNNSTGRNVGERRFSAQNADCHQLAASMGFAVAVQLQLMANEQATEATTSLANRDSNDIDAALAGREPARRVDKGEATLKLSAIRFDLVAPRPSRRVGWTAMLGLGPSVGFGLAPDTVGQGRIFLAARRAWGGFELGVEATARSTSRQDYGGGFQHQLRLGTVAACYWYGPAAACALAKFGQIQVQGVGVDVRASPSGFIAETGPRLAFELGLGRFVALLGHVEAVWLLTDWTVDVNHLAVWTMPRVATIAGIDVAARFR